MSPVIVTRLVLPGAVVVPFSGETSGCNVQIVSTICREIHWLYIMLADEPCRCLLG